MTREFGLLVPRRGPNATGTGIKAVATTAEALGFTSLWAGEHIAMPTAIASRYPNSANGAITWDAGTPWLDPLVALTWAAAVTSRATLGTAVLLLPLRDPIVTAKTLATLDHLSGGRVAVGVGAGWLREEFEILGQEFDGRGRRMDAEIEMMRRCWGDDPIALSWMPDGRSFHMQPKPVQGSGLRVLSGGKSPASIRRAARLGGWVPSHVTPELLREGVQQIGRLLAASGGSTRELFVAVLAGNTVEVTADLAARYFDAGADTVVCDARYDGSLDEALSSIEATAKRVLA